MKNPLLRGLQAVGLAPIGHVYESRARASRHAEARAAADAELRETRASVAHWKTKAEEVQVQLRELRGRLIEAERVETQLREFLMANETKLDLVEAAINALDQRTRREVGRGA